LSFGKDSEKKPMDNNEPGSTNRGPRTTVETFPNPRAEIDYTIEMQIPEFTCLCPKTGQPDFAVLEMSYVPADLCVELKSLKQYIWSFRDRGAFHEAVTNEIADLLDSTLAPRFLRIRAKFNVRGGIYTSVVVERRASDWEPIEAGSPP
jgi:7-cyano-7-deazaguanine reductase